MTGPAIGSFSSAAMRCKRIAAELECLLHRAIVAHETRRALIDLPDDLLKDVGLNRCEIPYVAEALVCRDDDRSCNRQGAAQ